MVIQNSTGDWKADMNVGDGDLDMDMYLENGEITEGVTELDVDM